MSDIASIEQLPRVFELEIPEDYLDDYGHMNVRYYAELWGRAAGKFMNEIGLDFEESSKQGIGFWLLRQLLDYSAEVNAGDTIAIYGRIIGRTNKILHNKYWMINETQGKLASTSEVLVGHADLNARRLANFPEATAERLDAQIERFNAMGLDAAVSGVLSLSR